VFNATDQEHRVDEHEYQAGVAQPNQSSASGRSAMDGSGLNIEVSVSSRSVPMRVAVASAVSSAAK